MDLEEALSFYARFEEASQRLGVSKHEEALQGLDALVFSTSTSQ